MPLVRNNELDRMMLLLNANMNLIPRLFYHYTKFYFYYMYNKMAIAI